MNWFGGKGGCFRHIINYIPPHLTFIESHLGGGNVLENIFPAASTIGIDADASVIELWKARPEYQTPGYTFIHGDAGSILDSMIFTGEEFIYSDPPYPHATRKSRHRYKHEMTEEEHEVWLKYLLKADCPAMISSYKNDLYMDILSGWTYREFPSSDRQGATTESLWMNYRPTGRIHDYSYVGRNYRERDAHRKKKSRWINNFALLPPAEMYSIYQSLSSHIAACDDDTGHIAINDDEYRRLSTDKVMIDHRQERR